MTLSIINPLNDGLLTTNDIKIGVESANSLIHTELSCRLMKVLALRNISSIVGEYLAHELSQLYAHKIIRNKHQDGYPDLVPLNAETKPLIEQNGIDKAFWSNFPGGGIEIKSTCGDVRQGSNIELMQSRLNLVRHINWKAHHRKTNNLLGVLWDFVNKRPTILAVFFSNSLNEEDWGKLVKPKENGGRTTSVSIIKKSGIQKMMKGCLLIDTDFEDQLKMLIKKGAKSRNKKPIFRHIS